MRSRALLSVLALFAIGVFVAAGEPAPRVAQVPEDGRVMRDEYGRVAASALYAPAPIYPYHARLQRLQGRGRFELLLRPDGTVSAVAVLHSTGVAELDRAAAQALIRWKFPPPKTSRIHRVRIPVIFNMLDRFKGGTILDR